MTTTKRKGNKRQKVVTFKDDIYHYIFDVTPYLLKNRTKIEDESSSFVHVCIASDRLPTPSNDVDFEQNNIVIDSAQDIIKSSNGIVTVPLENQKKQKQKKQREHKKEASSLTIQPPTLCDLFGDKKQGQKQEQEQELFAENNNDDKLFAYVAPEGRQFLQNIAQNIQSDHDQNLSKTVEKMTKGVSLFRSHYDDRSENNDSDEDDEDDKNTNNNNILVADTQHIHPDQEFIECKTWGPGGWAYLEMKFPLPAQQSETTKHECVQKSIFTGLEDGNEITTIKYHQNNQEQKTILTAFKHCIPAIPCRVNYNKFCKQHPFPTTTTTAASGRMSRWIFDLHNDVNRRNGKKQMDFNEKKMIDTNVWMNPILYLNDRKRVLNVIIFKAAMLNSHNETSFYHWNMFDILSKFISGINSDYESVVDVDLVVTKLYISKFKSWNTDAICTGLILSFNKKKQDSQDVDVIGSFIITYFSKTDKVHFLTIAKENGIVLPILRCHPFNKKKTQDEKTNFVAAINIETLISAYICKVPFLSSLTFNKDIVQTIFGDNEKMSDYIHTLQTYLPNPSYSSIINDDNDNNIIPIHNFTFAMLAESVLYGKKAVNDFASNILSESYPIYSLPETKKINDEDDTNHHQNKTLFGLENNNKNNKNESSSSLPSSNHSNVLTLSGFEVDCTFGKYTYCHCHDKSLVLSFIEKNNNKNKNKNQEKSKDDGQKMNQLQDKYNWCLHLEKQKHSNQYKLTLMSGLCNKVFENSSKIHMSHEVFGDTFTCSILPYYSLHIAEDLNMTNLIIHNTLSGRFHVLRVHDILSSFENQECKQNMKNEEYLRSMAIILQKYLECQLSKPWSSLLLN